MALERLKDKTVRVDAIFDSSSKGLPLFDNFSKFVNTELKNYEFRSGISVFLIRDVRVIKIEPTMATLDVDIGYLGKDIDVISDLVKFIGFRIENKKCKGADSVVLISEVKLA